MSRQLAVARLAGRIWPLAAIVIALLAMHRFDAQPTHRATVPALVLTFVLQGLALVYIICWRKMWIRFKATPQKTDDAAFLLVSAIVGCFVLLLILATFRRGIARSVVGLVNVPLTSIGSSLTIRPLQVAHSGWLALMVLSTLCACLAVIWRQPRPVPPMRLILAALLGLGGNRPPRTTPRRKFRIPGRRRGNRMPPQPAGQPMARQPMSRQPMADDTGDLDDLMEHSHYDA